MQEMSERLSFTLERELGGTDGDSVPEYVQVLPAGKVEPKGKTSFLVDGEAAGLIMSAFGEGKTDLVVDYEHQSLSGAEAPAAGWIKELEDRGTDGMWAKVQWTERAREYLKAREYRYLSPVVLVRKKDGRAVEVLGAALTNLPAIDGMEPVVNTARPVPVDAAAPVDAVDYKEAYNMVMGVLGLPEDACLEAAAAKISAMSEPSGFVPAVQFEALKAELKARETDFLIREAMTDGRLLPPLVSWARSYAQRDLDGFKDYMANVCPVVPLSAKAWEEGPQVDHDQRKVNRLLGIEDAVFVRYGRELSL